ncbi:MAG: DEAD/DEAH box helicase, partial [Eubacteriales bacterium]|nr:DEAD/DEAH box helicase [Eubacteriales bacterium]
MNVDQWIGKLKSDPAFMANVTRWETLPAREGRYADFPAGLDPRIQQVLHRRGIHRLYTHQAASYEAAEAGRDFVVVTPTASGKTMCYNLPVLTSILRSPDARALYLFPTKALSADQASELYELVEALSVDVKAYT